MNDRMPVNRGFCVASGSEDPVIGSDYDRGTPLSREEEEVAMGTGRGVAVVAGCSGTVARAIVSRLQAEQFLVAGLDGEQPAGDLALRVDLTDRADTVNAVLRVTNELGPITVLVTAPSLHDAAPFGEMSRDRWLRLLSAHLGLTTSACAAVVPGMARAGTGTVITLSSWLALAGIPGESYQASATGSILAFTKSFALEVARRGVRVNCIAVGPLEPGPGAAVPIQPSDVAATVMFLIDDGGFFVGQVLTPAGGAVL
jgi:NAD(P)-dependent dehydrogenase (short-subunit alcohol dehydrogenase family)